MNPFIRACVMPSYSPAWLIIVFSAQRLVQLYGWIAFLCILLPYSAIMGFGHAAAQRSARSFKDEDKAPLVYARLAFKPGTPTCAALDRAVDAYCKERRA